MSKTVTIASRAPMAFRISEPAPYVEPGKPAPIVSDKFAIVHGARHPAAVGEEGITENVDEEMFNKWMEVHRDTTLGKSLRVLSDDDLKKHREGVTEFGFQPGVDRASKDAPVSETTHGGPLTSDEMAAHSDTPNDDSPRSQTGQPAGTGI